MKKSLARGRRLSAKPALSVLSTLAAAALFAAVTLTKIQTAQASNPLAATLSSTATTSLVWKGTALGGVAPNSEADCQEGTNCDTFRLTLSGTPADWAGKVAHVEINWATLAHDYALFVRKGDNSGPVVATSDNPIDSPRTWEALDIDPSAWGTGDFSVHVVYFT